MVNENKFDIDRAIEELENEGGPINYDPADVSLIHQYPQAKNFCAEYFEIGPFSEYINGVEYSTLGINSITELNEGESLCDTCLSVTLRKKAPENLGLPEIYQGMRVVYKVIGEIRLE